MKILYHHRVASKDGQFVHIEEIIKAFQALGHEVVVVAPSSAGSRDFGQDSSIVNLVRTYFPDVVHELAEFLYSCFEGFKLRAAIVRHAPDVIYERYNLYFISGAWASRRFNLPYIVEVNSPLFEERSVHGGLGLPRLARWTENLVWRSADIVLPVTNVLAEYIKAVGVAPERISVIPNGVSRSEFRVVPDGVPARKKLGIAQAHVLGFTGFVREWHGLERVVELLGNEALRNWHFLVVGDGPVVPELKRQAEALGVVDRITFTGLVERAEIKDYISAFDVALQPDAVAYASPLKLFEYLAMGKAVLAPDLPNIREILTDGVNAILFDKSRSEDFIGKLLAVCSDSELRGRLGCAASQLIEERGYYWDNNAASIIRHFEMLLGDNRDSVAVREK